MDSFWAAYNAPPPLPLQARAPPLGDGTAIPPREWLLGTRLVRRFVSLLAAPGGVGKSSFALASAVSLASGRNILDEHVHHSVPAWVMNLEDPADELHRRLAALMRLHRIAPGALEGRLFAHHGRDRRLLMAEGGEAGVAHPDQAAVLAEVRAHGIGLVVVDPFVKSHTLNENDNMQMDRAVTAWAEVAEGGGCAVLLVHHTRKAGPGGADASVDAARGAKALSDAARSATVLSSMTPEEAEQLGVAAAERWRHVRVDDAKANMAPRAGSARWFRMETVGLGNGTALYPNGDQVAAVEAWTPQSPWAAHTVEELNRALDRIAAGPSPGQLYAPTRRGRITDRWGGFPLMDSLGVEEGMASLMIQTWIRNGTLEAVVFRDPDQRKPRTGLRVVDGRRPGFVPGAPIQKETAYDDAN